MPSVIFRCCLWEWRVAGYLRLRDERIPFFPILDGQQRIDDGLHRNFDGDIAVDGKEAAGWVVVSCSGTAVRGIAEGVAFEGFGGHDGGDETCSLSRLLAGIRNLIATLVESEAMHADHEKRRRLGKHELSIAKGLGTRCRVSWRRCKGECHMQKARSIFSPFYNKTLELLMFDDVRGMPTSPGYWSIKVPGPDPRTTMGIFKSRIWTAMRR